MSTRSNVIIEVKPEDIGKTIKFSRKKLPQGFCLEGWDGLNCQTTREFSKKIKLEKKYIGVYCHWSGYPAGVGMTLLYNFNDYDDILNLISGGSLSYIDDNHVRHYANRKGEKWDNIKPIQSDTIETCGGWTEYAYIYSDGCWHVGVIGYGLKPDGEIDYDIEYVKDIVELTDDVIKYGHPTYRG